MNNWEVNYEKIGEEADEIYENNQPYSYARAFIEAIIKVANIKGYNNQVTVLKSIDWLTQEAESETYTEEQIENMFTEEEKYKMTHACKFYGNYCGIKCDGLDKNCEIRQEFEPQQSKARFMKVLCPEYSDSENEICEDYINIEDIAYFYKNAEGGTAFMTKQGSRFYVKKPINEVIQQLGIEVV